MAAAAILFHIPHAHTPQRAGPVRFGPAGRDWDAMVLNGRGRAFSTRAVGAFSLKWMARGRARYELDRRPRTVSDQSALLVDQDQPYEMEFDARSEAESFCLFYARP